MGRAGGALAERGARLSPVPARYLRAWGEP